MNRALRYTSKGDQRAAIQRIADQYGISIHEPTHVDGGLEWDVDGKLTPEDLCNFANELGHSGVLALGDPHSQEDNTIQLNVRYTADSDRWETIGRIAGRHSLPVHKNFDTKGVVMWTIENAVSLAALSNFANELGMSGILATCSLV